MATGWVAETAARPQTTTPQLAELSFPTMELYAMPAATQALLDDAAVDIETWIAERGRYRLRRAGRARPSFPATAPTSRRGSSTYTKVAEASWSWGNLGYIATGVCGRLRGERRRPTC